MCHDGTVGETYSSLRYGPRVDLAREAPLPHPLTIHVEPTNTCNFKCKFCPESLASYSDTVGGLHSLALDDFRRICDNILELSAGRGISTLNLYHLGEPLVNVHLPDFIAYARTRGVARRVIVTSNGSLLRGARAERLAQSPPDHLRISIYGATNQQHQAVTSSKLNLELIRDNLAAWRLLPKGSQVRTYVKMIDQGEKHNSAFMQLFAEVADEVAIEPVMNWNGGENFAGKSDKELLGSEYFQFKKEVCPSPFYVLVIHSDLKVSVCCVDWSKQTVVGDLSNQTLRDVWQGSALHEFQMKHLQRKANEIPACANCMFYLTFPDNLDSLSPEVFSNRSRAYLNTGVNHIAR